MMNLFKKYCCVLLLLCSSLAVAQPAGKFNSPEVIQSWMDTYYLHPQPRQFLEAIQAASAQGMLVQAYRWNTLIGFVAGVVGRNPELADPLVDLMQSLPPSQRQPLLVGLVYANHAQSRAALQKLARLLPEYKTGVARYMTLPNPDITKVLPLEGNSGAIDANWGYFMATGSDKPVVRIMSALPWSVLKEDGTGETLSRIAVGRVAASSLRRQAATQPKVMAICKAQVSKQPKNVAGPLRNVIRQAQIESAAKRKS